MHEVELPILSEGIFNKALATAALAAAPLIYGGEIPLENTPKHIVAAYNLHSNIDTKVAQDMAMTAFEKVGDAAEHGEPTDSKAWEIAQQTYLDLAHLDYKVATAFLGKFNVNAKKLFGSQIKAIPAPIKAESYDLTDEATFKRVMDETLKANNI